MKRLNKIITNPCEKVWLDTKLPFFESLQDSINENELRKALLQKSDKTKAVELLHKLNDCCIDKPCNSPACSICSRNYRIYIISRVTENIAKPSDWVIVTLIYYSDAINTKDFCTFDVKQFKAKLYTQLRRAGFQKMVIGGLEIDFHTDIKRWVPHFHLLMGDELDALKKLRKMMLKKNVCDLRRKAIARPMKILPLTDVYEQISYNFKPYSMEVRAYHNHNDKRRTAKYRLTAKRFVLSLIKLDKIGFHNLCFQYKCRIPISKCQ